VHGSQKIGVVGRTGAGKSSLMAALFRIVELSSGSIHIDGLDISKLGLRQLRSKISIIPQDPFIFSGTFRFKSTFPPAVHMLIVFVTGTIRSNLDPFSQHDDVRLWDALRRSHLVNSFDSEDEKSRPRFTLDTTIEPEGSNLSVGERSLLSLARALCKDSQIVVMDEATARYLLFLFASSRPLVILW
jgi:ATP-binding cassette, subfamily C (CFTR/MRP), member 1